MKTNVVIVIGLEAIHVVAPSPPGHVFQQPGELPLGQPSGVARRAWQGQQLPSAIGCEGPRARGGEPSGSPSPG